MDDVVKEAMHLYCLASPKSNRWTGVILQEFNKLWSPTVKFKANPNSLDLRDINVQVIKGGQRYSPLRPTYWHDFGLIIRGPNPFNSEYMFTILAGRRGTGTEAACHAITDPRLLAKIHDKCDLSCYEKPFYAVVEMKRQGRENKYDADIGSLKIIAHGKFRRRSANKSFNRSRRRAG